MTEPLDPEDFHDEGPVDDEIKKLTRDNRALRMLLKDCKGELLKYVLKTGIRSDPVGWARVELLVQQIDDELKSE